MAALIWIFGLVLMTAAGYWPERKWGFWVAIKAPRTLAFMAVWVVIGWLPTWFMTFLFNIIW
jgi:hypothetical protein